MSELHRIVDWPEALGPDAPGPVLVVVLDGWIDAGSAATAAMAHLLDVTETTVVASFDAEALVDLRSRRPVVHLVDGVNRGVTWPVVELRHGHDADGHDVLFLVGSEPDVRWRAFVDEVCALALRLGTRMVVGLGAFPAAAPHTRPVRLSATSASAGLAEQVGGDRATIDAPSGVMAVLEHRFGELGVDAVTLWAQVPHYAASMLNPAASLVLLESLERVAGLRFDHDRFVGASNRLRERLDELVGHNPEHRAMVEQLEAQYDTASREHAEQAAAGDLAAEVERFLREVGGEG